jgi:hypothetical protein
VHARIPSFRQPSNHHARAPATHATEEVDAPLSPLPPRRCTSLEELHAQGSSARTAIGLKGQGSSPEQRRLSLRQDLATLTTTSMFDPTPWPGLQCLTSLRLQVPHLSPGPTRARWVSALSSAVSATCLVRLEITGLISAAEHFPLLPHLSSLRSLTHLAIRDLDVGRPACGADLQAGLSPLTRLQSLTITTLAHWRPEFESGLQAGLVPLSRLQQLTLAAPHFFRSEPPRHQPLHLSLPTSQLLCLTSVQLHDFSLDAQQPVALGAVQELELHGCRLDSLEALSACPHLTRLLHEDIYRDNTDVLAPFPASWREGLRSLKWGQPCGSGTMGWVRQLRGLTSLNLEYISMTPAFLRCDLDLASSQPQNLRWHLCVMRSCSRACAWACIFPTCEP